MNFVDVFGQVLLILQIKFKYGNIRDNSTNDCTGAENA